MVHAKFQDHGTFSSEEVLAIYGYIKAKKNYIKVSQATFLEKQMRQAGSCFFLFFFSFPKNR